MKINHSVAAVLSFVALLALLGPAAGALGKGETLSAATARSATRGAAWEVARRNSLVNSVKLGGCNRRAPDRFVCLAYDRGSTSRLATTCRVWVRVEGGDPKPKATVNLISCKNHRLALLKAAEAEAAMLTRGKEILGEEVKLIFLGRMSRTEIVGSVGSFRPANSAPQEICSAKLRAILIGKEVQVQTDSSGCSPIRS
jgi:hypothetical protein